MTDAVAYTAFDRPEISAIMFYPRRDWTPTPPDAVYHMTALSDGVALTAPYMHDGSLKTLKDVIEFYNRGGKTNPNRDRNMQPLKLTKKEVTQLVAFLKALPRTADPKAVILRNALNPKKGQKNNEC